MFMWHQQVFDSANRRRICENAGTGVRDNLGAVAWRLPLLTGGIQAK
jgi:hypothetical protein